MWNKLNALCTRNEKEGRQAALLELQISFFFPFSFVSQEHFFRFIHFSCKWQKIFDSFCMIIEQKEFLANKKIYISQQTAIAQRNIVVASKDFLCFSSSQFSTKLQKTFLLLFLDKGRSGLLRYLGNHLKISLAHYLVTCYYKVIVLNSCSFWLLKFELFCNNNILGYKNLWWRRRYSKLMILLLKLP